MTKKKHFFQGGYDEKGVVVVMMRICCACFDGVNSFRKNVFFFILRCCFEN